MTNDGKPWVTKSESTEMPNGQWRLRCEHMDGSATESYCGHVWRATDRDAEALRAALDDADRQMGLWGLGLIQVTWPELRRRIRAALAAAGGGDR